MHSPMQTNRPELAMGRSGRCSKSHHNELALWLLRGGLLLSWMRRRCCQDQGT